MRNFVRFFGTPLLLATAGAACSAAPESLEREGGSESEKTESSSAAISSTFCAALNKAATFVLPGNVGIPILPGCNDDTANSESYLGSAAPAAFASSKSKVEAEALYCAVAGSDGHFANAYVDTSLGKMGVSSYVNVSTKDPAALHVGGQRIGRLVAFGVMMDVESQEFDYTFPTEYQPAQNVAATRLVKVASPNGFGYSIVAAPYTQSIPAQTGQYAIVNEKGHHFDINAHVAIPTPIPGLSITAGMDFRHETPYDSANTNAYAMTTPGTGSGTFSNMFGTENASETARRRTWDNYVSQCNTCTASIPIGGINTCDCPDAKEQANHERNCGTSGCTDAYYRNLSDGRLPFEGDYGASGPYLGASHLNWWHFGTPAKGQIIPLMSGEQSYSILGSFDPSIATTHLEVDVGLAYGYKIFDVGLQIMTALDFRNGMAVRDDQTVDPDSHPAVVNKTSTWLDAEGRAHITADFAVSANIPFIGKKTVLHESYSLLDKSVRSNSANKNASSSVEWAESEPSAINGYQVGATETPVSSCLNVPAASKPAIVTDNPVDFATAVGQKAHDSIYPCNIRLCDPTTSKLNTCTWYSATNSMSCTATTQACTCADDHADMCDSSGKVYPGTDVGTNYCKQSQTCGTRPVCATTAECGTAGVCDADGCCEYVK